MKGKLLGILIIVLGAVLLVGLVYIIFIGDFSFDEIMSKFKKEKIIEQPNVVVDNSKNNNTNINNTISNPEVPRIVIDENLNNNSDNKNNIKQEDKNDFGKNELMLMASSFTERFGSFSNHSNFSNIEDLKIYMSRRMKNWADAFIAEQSQKVAISNIYYGITSMAVKEEIIEFDDDVGQATVLVKTRRRESTSSTNNTSDVFNQNIIISFIKEGNAWKVDSANWKDK